MHVELCRLFTSTKRLLFCKAAHSCTGGECANSNYCFWIHTDVKLTVKSELSYEVTYSTHRNFGRRPMQTNATCWHNIAQHCWPQHVAIVGTPPASIAQHQNPTMLCQHCVRAFSRFWLVRSRKGNKVGKPAQYFPLTQCVRVLGVMISVEVNQLDSCTREAVDCRPETCRGTYTCPEACQPSKGISPLHSPCS